ncbi:hydantoinase/oxoprolinase family protein [Methyloprofundus sp.]|uniref:hydantoinase/oxoprolinase family protein n=1 Tax=Methyloprofundus sp. TaxID=2020875 RepID=UPI003D09B74D
MRTKTDVIGWDIGGAHLKAAWLNSAGEVVAVYQEPCHLWQGLDKLEKALTDILLQIPKQTVQHVITMSGELVDLFSSRAEGVTEIIALSQRVLGQQTLLVYAGRQGFIAGLNISAQDIDNIASANWLASASYVASQLNQGLFIDIGSTTTDILIFQNQHADVLGYTDFQRLGSGELVYTGIVRTAVMAVSQSVRFAGKEVGVMSEYFASMADIYRLTKELNEQHDQNETADGQAKTELASARRLARMIGCDAEDFPLAQWQQLAYSIREQQLCRILTACETQILRAKPGNIKQLIGAGVGRFLAKEIAKRLGLAYVDFDSLFQAPEQTSAMQIADCAPAVAVAYLAIEDACISNIC